MSQFDSQKKSLLNQLKDKFIKSLTESQACNISEFADDFYQATPVEEMAERSLDGVYNATLSCWDFIQEHNACQPKVRVFNPDLEHHGWHCSHTIVQILYSDMPFLVDSVRMELDRQNVAVHSIHNAVLNVVRDNGQFQAFSVEGQAESFIYLEIDRHSDTDWLRSLEKSIAAVHRVVDHTVSDYTQMTDRLRTLTGELRNSVAGEIEEYAAFIEWLKQDHFIFVAYEEVAFSKQNGAFTVARVEGSELGALGSEDVPELDSLDRLSDGELKEMQSPLPIQLAKHDVRSPVHRPAYLDLVVIKRLDQDGNVVGEHRFYGLFTSPAFTERLERIPMIRQKVDRLIARAGFSKGGYNRKTLRAILNDLPRNELFLSSDDKLLETAMGIFNLRSRRKARLLKRRDRRGKFYSFLYYVPRDVFSTALRLQVQQILKKALKATDIQFSTSFSESVLARVYFVVHVDPNTETDVDFKAIEDEVVRVSHSWRDELHQALTDTCGEEQGNHLGNFYRHSFATAYREHFSPASAVYDIQRIEALAQGNPVTMSFYRVLEQSPDLLRFKLFHATSPLVLSEVIPVLENLGMRVISEHPYEVIRNDGASFWIHDFTLTYDSAEVVQLDEAKSVFQNAFANIWSGRAENDAFNRLVIGANLSWREVAMLRAYARYNQQIRFGFSQPYIADTLARYLHICKLLVALFRARFEPGRQSDDKGNALAERIESSIIDALEGVDNLNDDMILRRYLELMKATLRTNYFQKDTTGNFKDYFSFKLSPAQIADIPLPRPMFEVFVYSAKVEGVHLRGGKVARGGLRWSDRLEDYRTEVLGLVKAQQVKNAVIVPVGAKGGFVAKQLPERGSREEIQAEGIASYQTFISALLDITDNLKGGDVVPPEDVVRHDEDDPYFVVAADKGTATFSDIANAIAEERGFWLGDAFASGGSQGYDHKGMGITARGAWESVKLHFRELGRDIQSETFSAIGIGDMGGDVFGNGMLLSEHTQLVAAFNHLHIFIDPQPDVAQSYTERQRLFALPRSSWTDYNSDLISAGGGIFSRAAKSIELTAEIRQRFAIDAERLSPNDLIHHLLKAPVDLIWNGGIGTYVKASNESHSDVGDRANDSLRINGGEMNCKVLGEGGNLGFTQLGRIEFCAQGGKSNTDFIDNAGGVDCSDHEVNIKVLLNEVVANGDMTLKQRNLLLKEMTDDVAQLVLQNNYHQAQAISLAEVHAAYALEEYIRLINRLEADGKLNRLLEFIPEDDALQDRKVQQQGLTRPELSVLISYVKAELKETLVDTWVTRDPYLGREVYTAFPARLGTQFPAQIEQHRLNAEIISTQIANNMVNTMGITFAEQLCQNSGAALSSVAAAYVIARDVFDIQYHWHAIEALDNQIPAALQQQMMNDLIDLVKRATLWFLRSRHQDQSVADTVARVRPRVQQLGNALSSLLTGEPAARWRNHRDELTAAGVQDTLASVIAGCDSLYALLGIIQAADKSGQPLETVAATYFDLGERLELLWFDEQLTAVEVTSHWQALAREGCREDLIGHQQAITEAVLCTGSDEVAPNVQDWLHRHQPLLTRWQGLLNEIRNNAANDFSIFSVATRELLELAQARSAGNVVQQ